MAYEKDAAAILDAQKRLREGEDGALADIYAAARRMAQGMVERQCAKRRFSLSAEKAREKAHDAACYLATRFMKKKDFSLANPQSYIYTCVLNVLYHKKKVEGKIEWRPTEEMGGFSDD